MTFWILTWPHDDLGENDGANPVGWGSEEPPTVEEAIEQTWGVHAEMDWLEAAQREAMRVCGPYSTPRPPGEETMNAHGSCPARPGQTSGGGFAWHPHEPDESVVLHAGVGLVHDNMVAIGVLPVRVCKHCRALYVPRK